MVGRKWNNIERVEGQIAQDDGCCWK